jgi:hypothetical protein
MTAFHVKFFLCILAQFLNDRSLAILPNVNGIQQVFPTAVNPASFGLARRAAAIKIEGILPNPISA